MTTHLEQIERCARSTLAHQRKNNKIDIFMILQRVDYKINRQKLGHKLVDEMRYATVWDIQDAKENVLHAMKYLHEEFKYPVMSDKLIDDLVNTSRMHIYRREVGYTKMEWSMEALKMLQVKKYKPSWSLSRVNWDGMEQYLPHIFDDLDEAHIWLNYNCQYIPRKEFGVDNTF